MITLNKYFYRLRRTYDHANSCACMTSIHKMNYIWLFSKTQGPAEIVAMANSNTKMNDLIWIMNKCNYFTFQKITNPRTPVKFEGSCAIADFVPFSRGVNMAESLTVPNIQ